MHDGCAIAVPHSYDNGAAQEAADIASARLRGVDGFQTNQVDVAVRALGRAAPSEWRRPGTAPGRACLVNPTNGYGLIGRSVTRADGTQAITGVGGCVDSLGLSVSFAGDGAARAAGEVSPH
jgi:hypothetical protein